MKVIWLLILVVIASCTLPETNTIFPKFNVEIEMLTSTLKGLRDFEDVEIETQVTQRRIIGDFSKKTWEEEILTLEDLKL
jgi:hypothetical protein